MAIVAVLLAPDLSLSAPIRQTLADESAQLWALFSLARDLVAPNSVGENHQEEPGSAWWMCDNGVECGAWGLCIKIRREDMSAQGEIAPGPAKQKELGRTLLAIVLIVVILAVVGLISSQFKALSAQVSKLAGVEAPPFFVAIENAAPTLAVIMWILMGAVVVALLVMAFVAPDKLRKLKLAESWKPLDVILGLVAGGVLSGLTGYLWAVWNPVPILPPFIHLRIFSFLICVWGIVFGRATGFLTGYFGGMVWALVGGYFVLVHTPVADGFWVGLMTGWFVSVFVRRGRSREELLAHIDEHRWAYYGRCAIAGLIGGLVMSFGVALSLKMTSTLSWWASFWAIGVLSDTLPMIIWTGPVSEAVLRLTRRLTWLPDF